MDDDPVVDDVAGAIVDGTRVDWDSAQQRSAASNDLLKNLELLAKVADVHRRDQNSMDPATPPDADPPIDVWGHLRLLERIGRGASGDVYRAWDPKLDREVALKLTWIETPDDRATSIIEEGRLLARVRHPNVVTIHGADRIGGRIGLWMEYLRGTTLEDGVRTGQVVGLTDALAIGIAVCDAVSAVHAAGLLHRDIKAHNIMRAEDGRIVLMDFGAGRESHASTHDLTGTPLYMAPEVLAGQAASQQSEVYAIGVLLYHVLTNRYPIEGTTIDEVRRSHEQGTATALSTWRRDLPARLGRIISRAIAPDLRRRYASAEALRADLRSLQVRPRRMAIGAAIATVAAAVGLGWWLWPADTSAVRTVAIVGFTNAGGQADDAWFSDALVDMLTREAMAGGIIRATPAAEVDRMSADLGLQGGREFDRAAIQRIGRYLGSQMIVDGSYTLARGPVPRSLRVNIRIRDASSGARITDWTDSADETRLFDLATRLGARLRVLLGRKETDPALVQNLRTSWPTSADALRAFAEGQRKLRQSEGNEARQLFERVVAADPAFARGHLALSEAWLTLRQPANARASLERAFELSGTLPREEQLVIEAQYRRLSGDSAGALKIQEALVAVYPHDIDHALRLASALVSSNRRQDALGVIEGLRRVSVDARSDPRVDLVEAQASRLTGNLTQARAAAASAVAGATTRGARGLMARAHQEEAFVLEALGQPAEAAAGFQAASGLYLALGDLRSHAGVQRSVGLLLRRQGDFLRARQEYERAHEALAAAGSTPEALAVLHDIAFMLEAQGDIAGARTIFEARVLPRFPAGRAASLHTSIGRLHLLSGDLPAADRSLQTAIDQSTSPMTLIEALLVVYALRREQGDLGAARRAAESALALSRLNAAAVGLGFRARHALAATLIAAGDVGAARVALDEVVLTDGAPRDVPASHALVSAVVAREEGRAGEAITAVRQAAEYFRAQGLMDAYASALAELARLVTLGPDVSEAPKLVDQARDATRVTQNLFVRADIIDAAAAVAAKSPLTAAARQVRADLDAILAETRRLGLIEQTMHLTLALGQLEIAIGERAVGLARLAALEKDAAARKFKGVAAKAALRQRAPRPRGQAHHRVERPNGAATVPSPLGATPGTTTNV